MLQALMDQVERDKFVAQVRRMTDDPERVWSDEHEVDRGDVASADDGRPGAGPEDPPRWPQAPGAPFPSTAARSPAHPLLARGPST